MLKISPLRGLLMASLLLLFGAAGYADSTVAFQEAQRHGDDAPGSSLHWTFRWDGKDVEIGSNGKGRVGNRELQIPLNSTRLTANLRYGTYKGDLLVLVEETDEESAAGKLVRFASKTLKPKWNCDIPSFNVGPALIEGKSVYLSARATAMKVNLEDGHWDWRKTNLNRHNESTAYRFNAFALPTVTRDTVTFPEVGSGPGAPSPGGITFNKADGEILEVR